MLDRLPDRALELIVQYLRSVDNNQLDPLCFAQVNRRLRQKAIKRVWEYFTLSKAIQPTGATRDFLAVLPHLSRLQIADDRELSSEQWITGLDRLSKPPCSWTHISMVSVELDGFIGEQRTLAVVERVMRFAVEMLANIKELWVSLPQDSGIAGKLLGHKYANVEEIRLVGRSAIQEIAPVLIPNYSRLTAISLDRQSAAATSCSELVVRSQQTLRELNIEEYTVELGSSLRLLPGSEWAAYPQLRQLAISQVAGVYDRWMVDGARLDAVEMLYFRDTEYPATGAGNRVLESTHVRLMGAAWARLRLLVVDSLSRGDVERLGSYAPRLEVLRVGLLGGDVHLEAGGQPAAALDLAAVAVILQTCRQLEDFSVETPEPYEDVYNARCPHSETVACWERPYDLGQRFGPLVVDPPHTRLRALMLNAWALTFDQLRSLFGALPALNSFEGNLKFTSDSYSSNFINDGRMGGSRLAHVSLVLSAPPTRHPRAFKSSLLRFVGGLPALRMLEIYGSADMPGIEDAVARVAPGCVAGFYSLTENGCCQG